MLGLAAYLDRFPRQLSGGQRQRVAMGRAIARRPALFLFDEPLSNLDAALRTEMRREIRRLHDREGATSLYVTHDQTEAMTLADTLHVLKSGTLEQSGPPLEVYERPRTLFVGRFFGSPPMNTLPGVLARHEGSWWVKTRAGALEIDPARFAEPLVDGRSVIAGVRPHDFSPLDGSSSLAKGVALHVERCEPLGHELCVHGHAGDEKSPLVLSLRARELVPRKGDVLALSTKKENVHLFDADTERALG